jgi:hypothetical protein
MARGISSKPAAQRLSPWRHRYQTAGAPDIARRPGVSPTTVGSSVSFVSPTKASQPLKIAQSVAMTVRGPSLFYRTCSNTLRRARRNTNSAQGSTAASQKRKTRTASPCANAARGDKQRPAAAAMLADDAEWRLLSRFKGEPESRGRSDRRQSRSAWSPMRVCRGGMTVLGTRSQRTACRRLART